MYEAIVRKMNIDRSRIKEIAIGPTVEPLLAGQIDAMDGQLDNEPIQVRHRGHDVAVIPYESLGLRSYGVCLVTRASLVQSRPDIVARFLRATFRGWEYAIQNPEQAAESVHRARPELDTAMLLAQTKASFTLLMGDDADKYGLGWQTESGWKRTADTLRETGQITGDLDLGGIFSNRFLQDGPRIKPPRLPGK
jgi:NitT/TauT family transport system substrate-binding protein